MSRVVVLGGSAEMGRRVVDRLSASGQDVLAASRATGVDALSGSGLDDEVLARLPVGGSS